MQVGQKEVVAWHWLDETTLMVLTEDMEWFRLEGVYLADVQFPGLDYDSSETCEITLTQRYSSTSFSPQADQPTTSPL